MQPNQQSPVQNASQPQPTSQATAVPDSPTHSEWTTRLGWEPGYYHHRPPTALKNVSAGWQRGISDAARGLFPGTKLQADMLVISEKEAVNSKTRVLRIITQKSFPRIVLNRRANDTLLDDTVDDMVSMPSKYLLEGDFHSYYDMLYQKGTEQVSLQVLTPDVMQSLVQLPRQLDVELSGNSIFVYFRSGAAPLEQTYSVDALLTAGSLLIRELVDKTFAASSFTPQLMQDLEQAYTVSSGRRFAHNARQFIWQTGLYVCVCLFLEFTIIPKKSVWQVGFVAAAIIGYVLLVIHYVRRVLVQRTSL